MENSTNMREARIQEVLDNWRSGSSASTTSNTSLAAEEEDELEGKAGDSGSARVEDFELTRDVDALSGDFPMERLSTVSGSFEVEGRRISDGHVVPITDNAALGRERGARSEKLHKSLEFVSVLAYLTTFGIIGVIVRFLLEELFGPHVARITSNSTALFIDLPANMLGSFFMGWVGVVFKKDIALFSEHLAVGLSTGLMGCITTYAAMIQRNLAIMVAGKWVDSIVGLLIGLHLAQMSLVVGVDSAQLLLRILERINYKRECRGLKMLQKPLPDNRNRRILGLILFLFLGSGMWFSAGVLTVIDTASTSRRTLWLACLVGPPGVWMRWYFARLNGHGIGAKHHFRWLPTGTFLVNICASSLEAALSCVSLADGKYTVTLAVSGINLGLLGCLSTVSTFAAEIQVMHQGNNRWRSYAYPLVTVFLSMVIGVLVYGVPVWVLGL